MTRYNLLTESDIIKGKEYECICLVGNNPTPQNINVFYDKYGHWHNADNNTILEVVENSVMLVLAKENFDRYQQIVKGGKYEDGVYKSHYYDCEELYPVII